MRTETLVFGLALIVGFGLVGYGYSQPPYDVGVCTDPVDRTDGDTDGQVVSYQNLSADEQELFDRTRNQECVEYWPPEQWSTDAEYIETSGEYYSVSVYASDGGRIIYFALGGGLTGLAVVGFAAVRGLRRLLGGKIRLFSE